MNGWSNRETWLVNLWFSPGTEDDVNYVESWLENEFMDLIGDNGIYADLINFGTINWNELRGHCNDTNS